MSSTALVGDLAGGVDGVVLAQTELGEAINARSVTRTRAERAVFVTVTVRSEPRTVADPVYCVFMGIPFGFGNFLGFLNLPNFT